MDFFVRSAPQAIGRRPITLKCPACLHAGVLNGFGDCNDVTFSRFTIFEGKQKPIAVLAGMRYCPNPNCGALIFFAQETNGPLISYPPEVIDFDATNLPPKILDSLKEAVSCHAAGCYKATALLVRRILEELCEDREAKGNDLKKRLESLGNVVVIPPKLLAAADELRILGNDAAHVEAKAYDQIGKDEAELAIVLAKELLKATYQYESLVSRLLSLKKPGPAATQDKPTPKPQAPVE